MKIINKLIVFVILFGFYQMSAQDCIDYPEIDGSECLSCAPSGWVVSSGTPDIILDDGTWPGGGCEINDISGASPTGGNMVLLASAAGGFSESITTTITGLSTDQEYVFGIYWEEISVSSCDDLVPGSLSVIIDGEEYNFNGEEDWALVEICFTPSQSSIDIEVLDGSGDSDSAIIVDSAECDEITPCCPLLVSLEEEGYEICPDEEFFIEGEFSENEGDVIIEWVSDPPDGIDYLDNTNIMNPTFSFPENENFEGAVYEFTVSVQDDNCSRELMLEVTVNSSEVPDFDIEICELDFQDVFPNESENGYTGTWTGDFNFENLAGTISEYTFTLDAGQENCIQEYVYQIPIDPASEVTFSFDIILCELDDNSYVLPEESEEGIEGIWDVESFNPYELGTGTFTFLFQPYDGFCYFHYEAEIEITESMALNFEIPNSFCASTEDYDLPSTSEENVFGIWEIDEIDLSTSLENETLIFFPEESENCYENYMLTYSVLESISNTFIIADSICRGNGVIVFDSLSQEGNLGFWEPSSINVDTILGDIINIMWTPIDQSNDCLIETVQSIAIVEPTTPFFNLPTSLCKNSGPFVLPFNNGIDNYIGTWNIDTFDPDTIIENFVDLTFTSADSCAINFSSTINIMEYKIPEFSIQTEFCSSDNVFILPLISDNNIAGTWTIIEIDPGNINNQLTSIFIPDDINGCYSSVEITFTINNLITPLFDLPESFCINDEDFTFPNISINNIEGLWSQTEIMPSIFSENQIANVFTPIDLSCNEEFQVIIPFINFDDVIFTTTDASSCSVNDGQLMFELNSNIEYSIDNGISWQSTATVLNIGAGIYDIIVRSTLKSSCTEEFQITILAPSAPIITRLEISPISDCGEFDGSIQCTAEGSDLEFSIDGGSSWQSDNTFTDLAAGDYTILVRSNNDLNCISQQSFAIEDVIPLTIENVIVNNISNCDLEDGKIEILPNDPSLEYSIDNGLSWQESPIFENLMEGNYNVLIRLLNSPNCLDSRNVTLSSPDVPSIESINTINPTDCNIEDGSLEILATGNNLEYSIDNGIAWFADNTFENLPASNYTILIREINATNCIDQLSATLETPNTPDIISFNILPPSDCISNDGSILIEINNLPDIEFSIDGGSSWQDANEFDNLMPKEYIVFIRNKNAIDCFTSLPFEIRNPPCPCNDLTVDLTSQDVNCFDNNSGSIEILNIVGFYTNEDYDIVWSNGSDNTTLNNIATGWYSYLISYDNNCSLIDSVFVDAFDPIAFGLLSFDPNCTEAGSIEVTNIDGGSGVFQYSIDGLNFQNDNVFVNLSADEYQVIVQDNLDCTHSDEVTLNSDLNIELEIPSIEPISIGESIFLNPLINQTTIDSFEWTPTLGILNSSDLIAEVSPEQTTEYTLTIYFGDCVETRTITVEVIEQNDIYTGNTFSPNFDGNNDYFFIQSSLKANLEITAFKIYDRWGNLVFDKQSPEINNEKDGWNGTKNGKVMSIGVYTYMIQYSINQEAKITTGHLTLVK